MSGITVDFRAIGKSVILDDTDYPVGLNLDEQGEIAQIALQALETVNIPGADLNAGAFGDGVSIGKEVRTFVGAPGQEVELKNQGVTIANATMHFVSAGITIMPGEDGGSMVQLSVTHDGSYNGVQDAVTATITYELDAENNITGRDGSTTRLDGGRLSGLTHEDWAKQAVQALEHSFTTMMGDQAQAFIAENRPENAATQAGPPPMAANPAPLSGLDLKAVAGQEGPAVQAAPAIQPGMSI